MLIFACVIRTVNTRLLLSLNVKALVRINQWEVTHCTSEGAKEQSGNSWQSAICICIYLHNVIAFSKCQYENDKEQHEVDDVVNHLDHHHDQKAELSEYPDEIENLYQGKYHAQDVQDLASIRDFILAYIQDTSWAKHYDTQDLKQIPIVFEVLFPDLTILEKFVSHEH